MTKKAKHYLDKGFLLKISAKLLFVQISFLIFSIFMTGGGHGTYIQFPIFYSWLLFPIVINYYNWPINDAFLAKTLLLYFSSIPIILFALSLILAFAIYCKKVKKKFLFFIIIFYTLGTVIDVLFSKQFSFFTPTDHLSVLLIGLILSGVILFFFWKIFFNLHKND